MTNHPLPSAPPADDTQQERQDPFYPIPTNEYFQQRAEALRYPVLAAQTQSNASPPPHVPPRQPTQNAPQPCTQPQQLVPHVHANAPHPGGVHNVSHHTVHVVQQPVLLQQCRFCQRGVVRTETDVCCFVCLVLLAIFTFPIGLVFLCCLGCTFRRRCVVCRRRN